MIDTIRAPQSNSETEGQSLVDQLRAASKQKVTATSGGNLVDQLRAANKQSGQPATFHGETAPRETSDQSAQGPVFGGQPQLAHPQLPKNANLDLTTHVAPPLENKQLRAEITQLQLHAQTTGMNEDDYNKQLQALYTKHFGNTGFDISKNPADDHAANLAAVQGVAPGSAQRFNNKLNQYVKGYAKQLDMQDMRDDIMRTMGVAQDMHLSEDQYNQDLQRVFDKHLNPTHNSEDDLIEQTGLDANGNIKNPYVTNRIIQAIKKDHPEQGKQLDADHLLMTAMQDQKGLNANAYKVLQAYNGIKNGDYEYDHVNNMVVKPLGFWGSIAHGWNQAEEEKGGYNQFSNGTPEENIAELEKRRAQYNQYDPVEMPKGWGYAGEMIGSNGLMMGGATAVQLGTTALGVPEAAPWLNSMLMGQDTYRRSWYNSYVSNYNQLRNQGVNRELAEQNARSQADFDAKMNTAKTMVTAFVGSKMGVPEGSPGGQAAINQSLDRGFGELLEGDPEYGNMIHTTAPFDESAIPAFKKIAANLVGDKTGNLAKRVVMEGGATGVINSAIRGIQNSHEGKDMDEGMGSEFWGNMLMSGALAVLGHMGNTIQGLPKENMMPEVNPDTEDGAKLFIQEAGEPKIENEDLLNKAKKAITGTPHANDISSDDDLLYLTRDIAEKAHNPQTAAEAEQQYGKNLVDISKELHPAESFNTQEPDITKPLEEQITPDMTTGEISSLKNKYTAQARNALGMPEVEEPARKEFGTSWDEAKQGIANGTINPENLVAEALKKPRPWSDVENAAVLHHQVDKETQLKGVETKINELGPDGDSQQLSDLNTQRAQLRDQLQDIYTAGKRAGTENARGLAIRKMLADQNYSLASMMDQKQAAQNGAPLTDAQKADVESQYKNIQDAKEQRDKMTAAGFTADPNASVSGNAKVQRAQLAFNKSLAQPKTGMTKYGDAFVNWQREFKLSNPLTLGKLAVAGLARTGLSPIEQLLGGAQSLAPENSWMGQLAKKATSETGFNIKNEADALTNGFMKGIQDMSDIWKTGKSDLDFIDGKKQIDEDGINFFGKLHKFVKAPVKRIAFERSWRNQVSNLMEQGINPTDPAVMAQISIQAMKDANRAIFMQDNMVSKAMNAAVQGLNRQGKAGELTADALKFLIPFVKVPTNIVGETANYVSGGLPGWYKLIKTGFQDGFDKMTPDEANFVARNIKKGSLGLAVMSYAFFHPEDFGGLYRPGVKEDDDELKEGQFKFMGQTVPKWASEAPIIQAAQVAATLRKYMDGHKDGESDIPLDVMATAFGLAKDEPLGAAVDQFSGFLGPESGLKKGIGQYVKGTVDPAILQQWARWQQGDTKLKPEGTLLQTTGQSIESGLPYLWHNVPEKEQK